MPTRFLCSLFVLIFLQINIHFNNLFAQYNNVKFNYVFIVDISGSMEGLPHGSGNIKIFPEVKKAITNFINQLDNRVDNTVFIYPFSANVIDKQSRQFKIKTTNDKQIACDYINGLVANGSTTHIYDSFIQVINGVNNYLSLSKNNNEKTIYYLYTDGRNEGGSGTMDDLINQYQLQPQDRWVFYTNLGPPADTSVQQRIRETPNWVYRNDPTGTVSPIRFFQPVIPFFNFGNLKKTNLSSKTELFIYTDLNQSDTIVATLVFKELSKVGAAAKIEPFRFVPSNEQTFKLTLVNAELIQEGIYEDTLTLTALEDNIFIIPDKIPIKFSFTADNIINLKPPFNESFPLEYDDITSQNIVQKKVILTEFNDQSKRNLSNLIFIKFEPSEDNPSEILLGRDILINDSLNNTVTISPSIKELIVKVLFSDKLNEGEYKGRLLFDAPNFVFSESIEGIDSLKENPSIKYIDLSFRINNPWPIWIKILFIFIALILLGIIIWFGLLKKKKFPVFDSGNLLVEKNVGNKWELVKTISMKGFNEIVLGNTNLPKKNSLSTLLGQKVLYESSVDYGNIQELMFYVEVESGKIYAKLKTLASDQIKVSYDRFKNVEFFDEKIYDNDILTINNQIRIEYQNYNSPRASF